VHLYAYFNALIQVSKVTIFQEFFFP